MSNSTSRLIQALRQATARLRQATVRLEATLLVEVTLEQLKTDFAGVEVKKIAQFTSEGGFDG
jgi:uncharacterized SAM-dependent methyltransferase